MDGPVPPVRRVLRAPRHLAARPCGFLHRCPLTGADEGLGSTPAPSSWQNPGIGQIPDRPPRALRLPPPCLAEMKLRASRAPACRPSPCGESSGAGALDDRSRLSRTGRPPLVPSLRREPAVEGLPRLRFATRVPSVVEGFGRNGWSCGLRNKLSRHSYPSGLVGNGRSCYGATSLKTGSLLSGVVTDDARADQEHTDTLSGDGCTCLFGQASAGKRRLPRFDGNPASGRSAQRDHR